MKISFKQFVLDFFLIIACSSASGADMAPGFRALPESGSTQILERSKSGPRAAPVISISELLNRELGPWTNSRVHLHGSVESYDPEGLLVIRDPTGTLRVRVTQAKQIQQDSRIEVWGFLRVSPGGYMLEDGDFQQSEPAARPKIAAQIPGENAPSNLPKVLTRVAEILKLPANSAALEVPVRLRGMITYADTEWGTGFFHDGTGEIYFDLSGKKLRPGQFVELSGQTQAGLFAPSLTKCSIEVLGTTNFPAPMKIDLEELAGGGFDAQWIELEGIVRRATLRAGHLYLTVMTPTGKFSVIVPDSQMESPTDLIDASIRVKGVCGSEVNSRHQLSGIYLHTPALEQITILNPGAADPFARANIPISAVGTFDSARIAGRRLKVTGVVTLRMPGNGLYLQDASGGIRILASQTNDFAIGDQLQVVGFPAIGDFEPHLEEAIFKRTSAGLVPSPQKMTAEDILRDENSDGVLVQTEARLIQDVRHSANPQIILQEGPIIFTAQVESFGGGWGIASLTSGSVVRLTGVCSIQAGDRHEAKAFRLLLRGPADIQLVHAAPWWTPRHSAVLGVAAMLSIGLGFGWVISLRRQVRSRTEIIRQKLAERDEFARSLAKEKQLLSTLIDHLPDSVFVKDLTGRCVLANHANVLLHEMDSLEHFVGKVASEIFPPEAARMYAETDQIVLTQGISLVDIERPLTTAKGSNRWTSTTNVPLKDEAGKVVGLVGITRDITDRKRHEAELAQAHRDLLEVSRLAGMAEIATGVLHNVGNVLNSVNVSATLVAEKAQRSKVFKLIKISEMLRAHTADLPQFLASDPQGTRITGYIEQLAEHLALEQNVMIEEIEALRKNVDHIKEIVASQQTYAKVSGVFEMVNVTDVVEDALRMNDAAFQRHRIQLVRDYSAQPTINLQRHKILQIVVNLIRNAKQACQMTARSDRQVRIEVSQALNKVLIVVKDNGVGIPPENVTRIFAHGFTTRKDGHGFGLHSGALAAKEMGGALTVQSEGPGCGSVFTLELPVPEAMEHASIISPSI